jgi:hypothetical protein
VHPLNGDIAHVGGVEIGFMKLETHSKTECVVFPRKHRLRTGAIRAVVHYSRNHPLINIALRGDMDSGVAPEDLASTANWRDLTPFRKANALKFLTPKPFCHSAHHAGIHNLAQGHAPTFQ